MALPSKLTGDPVRRNQKEGRKLIYLDNAATTIQKPECVYEAVVRAMKTMGNASRGAHEGSLQAVETVYHTRQKLAELFGCPRADHVVFTSNSTEALNTAICGIFNPGDHVITTDLEHHSVLRPLYRLRNAGIITLDFVPADRKGRISLEDFESRIGPGTRAIVCTHASNLTGNVVDLAAVGAIAHAHGLLLIADASQTAGAIPIDMERMGIDVLCFTGHKALMGPQGTGGMCIREGVEIRPLKVGGSGVHSYDESMPERYPGRLEAGTLNSHGIAGLGAAVHYLSGIGIETVQKREAFLTRLFYDQVSAIPGVTVYGDFESPHTGIVTLNIGNLDSALAADALSADYDIAVRAGAHCAPRMHQALGTAEQGAVRFSFSWFTTEEAVCAAVSAVRDLARSL